MEEQSDFEIRQHVTGGLSDQLYDAYCAGRADESGAEPPKVRSVTTASLLMLVRRRWLFEHTAEHVATLGEAPPWLRELAEADDPQLTPDEIPSWLLAHAERQSLPMREYAHGPVPLPPMGSK